MPRSLRSLPGLLLPALALAACARKPAEPTLEFATVGFILHMPDAMQKALDAAAPGFRPVKPNVFRSDVSQAAMLGSGKLQALFATIGDFDGDGAKDLIIEGAEPSDSALHVIAIMNGPQPRAFEVTKIALYDADAVGVYLSQPADAPKGSFDVINYPDASTRFTYKAGGFTGTNIGS